MVCKKAKKKKQPWWELLQHVHQLFGLFIGVGDVNEFLYELSEGAAKVTQGELGVSHQWLVAPNLKSTRNTLWEKLD